MRVIAGKARSMPLETIPGDATRPTTDRIKETLFNMLQPYIPGCRFLDLFAGSGAIGIEALSRGADAAVFVEKNRRACACIRRNLAFTKLEERGKLLEAEAVQALYALQNEEPFDIIFMDPPYASGSEWKVLEYLKDSRICTEDTIVIIEAALNTDYSKAGDYSFDITREKTYKTNKHIFLRKECI